MKKLKTCILVLLILVIGGTTRVNAQNWLKKLGERAEKAATNRLERKVDKTIDKALDKAENSVKDNNNKKKKKTRKEIEKGKNISDNEQQQAPKDKLQTTKIAIGDSGDKCAVYFISKKGSSIEVTNYDAKDRVVGYIRNEILDVQNASKGLIIKAMHTNVNKKGEIVSSGEVQMKCEENVFYIDLRNMLDAKTLKILNDPNATISGNNLQLPAKITTGQSLPDANLTITVPKSELPLPPTIIPDLSLSNLVRL